VNRVAHKGGAPRTLCIRGAFTLLILLAGTLPSADAQQLQFRHLHSGDGLAGEWVRAIEQDDRGFMWFGTSTGLSRYDGYTMETFRHDAQLPTSLPHNNVNVIRMDHAGALWVGTSGGLARYDRMRNSFTTVMASGGARGTERSVQELREDSRGTLWVGTIQGLFRLDRTTDAVTLYPLPKSVLGGQQLNIVLIHEDRRGHLLIGTYNDGLFDLEPVSGALRHFAPHRPDALEFPGAHIAGMAEDHAGRLWVATYDAGLVLFDPETNARTVYRNDPRDSTSLSTDHLRTIVADAKGILWIGTENGGLEHFDPAIRKFTHSRADPNNPSALSSDSFWSLYYDATGALWAGTFSGGINVLQPTSAAIQRYSVIGNDATSLGHNDVLGMAQDSAGMFWIATDGGGLSRLDPATGRFKRYTSKTSNLNKDAVQNVAADPDGTIWVATWEGGVSRFDPHTEKFTAYTKKNSNIPDDHAFSVHVDRKRRVWVGTWERGLAQFHPQTGSFTEYHFDKPGLESQIWIIHELRDGRLLLGTLANGMILFDPRTAKMTTYSAVPGNPRTLGALDVRAIAEESPGIVWIGTSAGLDRLDLGTSDITHYTTRDGLPSNMISGVVFDRAGKLWVSTDNAVAQFDPARKRSWLFSVEDGLQAREFTARSYLRGRNGELLFGGNNGFNLIRPELIRRNTREPRIVFTKFEVFNKPVTIGGVESPLSSQISEARQITLTHAQSVFTIGFAALDYAAPGKNQYAYKLEGFDHDWTYVGTTRSATYTNLPAGAYVFRVRASNNDGLWNETGASIAIRITPPLWATWWFRSLLVLSVVGVVAAIIRSAQARHRRLRAMNEQLGLAAEHDRESQQYLERNVLDILGAMQRFSTGDFDVTLAVQSEDAIGKLRQGFNAVVADRQRAEEELRQSQKMEAVGRLAGGVAHDFNNLLTVIKGNTTLALGDMEGEGLLDARPEVREELQEVEKAAERASALTRQLLAFSRKQILQPRILSLNEIVHELGHMLHRTVGEDIALEIVLTEGLGRVKADPGQIEQVLINLVVNARDAMPRGGKLRIGTRNVDTNEVRGYSEAEERAYVALVVTDTGTGMTAEVKDRVFEPFFTTKEQGHGTGLGLATVYGIVKQSGGFVLVQSEPGEGSTFSIYLPRTSAVDEEQSVEKLGHAPTGIATVLLAEDEPSLRLLTSRVLRRAGYTVLSAQDGEAAIELASGYVGTIDLLLTDVVMPGLSGRALAERLMPLRPGMRLLYASGYTEDAIVRHGVSSEETAFLSKPYTPDDLLRKVREVLDVTVGVG
jgi:signal transduction histidine kinase/ligand-binding sensor domain-containing protein/ActR/RegA family two-component response regulator